MADQGAERTDGELFVLRNGEIDANPRSCHDKMATDLPDRVPSGALKRLRGLLPGYVAQAPHAITRQR